MHIKPPRRRRCLQDGAHRSCSKAGVWAHACRAEAAAVQARGGVRRSASAAASARWATSKISLSLQTSVSYGLSVFQRPGSKFGPNRASQKLVIPMGTFAGNAIGSRPAPLRATLLIFFSKYLFRTLFFCTRSQKGTFKRFPTKWYTFSLFESMPPGAITKTRWSTN